MKQEVTNKDLAKSIKDLTRLVTASFWGLQEDMKDLKDIKELEKRMAALEQKQAEKKKK
jgi:hypothetical protein